MEPFIFDGWRPIIRTLCVGFFAYVGIVMLLRASGRRTLSKMNAFDFIVTIALGSALATVLLNKNVTLTQGIAAFSLLIGMQYLVTWLSVRTTWVKRMVTGEPALLYYQGGYLRGAMKAARVTEAELLAAARASGVGCISAIEAVVLETDGSFSVIKSDSQFRSSSLSGVKIPAG